MKRIPLADVLDILFYPLAVGFLALGILRYFRIPMGVAIAFTLLLVLASALVTALLLSVQRNKKTLGKKEAERKEALLLHLALEKEERVRASFLQALLADGKDVSCSEDAIRLGEELFIPLFTMQPLSADSIAVLLRKYGTTPFTVACNTLTPEAERLLKIFGKRAFCADEVYGLFVRTGFPEPLICGNLPRKTVKQKLMRTFSKKNARPFFACGAFLLFMSLFAIFPLYYLVSGALLLLSSVFIRAFGYA